jgi:hypothetical protein
MTDFDTIDTAYAKAQNAKARGLGGVLLTIDANGRRASRRYMRAFAEVPGVDGWVIRQLVDSDGVTEAYELRVDVVDVLAAYFEVYRKRIETPVVSPRRKRVKFSR